MKKFLLLVGMICVTRVANAQTEYYVSAKLGAGDTTIYVNDDDKIGEALVKQLGSGYKYNDSGFLWEGSVAVGLDWAPGKMYVKKNPYDWFHLRLEAEFSYNNYHESGKLRQNYVLKDEVKLKYYQFFALASGYADFKIDDVVPYVGLGIGYSFGNGEIRISGDDVLDNKASNAIDDDGVIYALHAGVGYKYSDITTLDLGFRRVYAPAEDGGRYIFDTLRLGARFRI